MTLQTPSVLPTTIPVQKIAVLNQSTVVSNREVQTVVHALMVQVRRDFGPVWSVIANLQFYPDPKQVPLGHWQFIFFDTADQAGALGYHELTPADLPLGKVFVKTCVSAGISWSSCASHELLEILIDPYADLLSMAYSNTAQSIVYAVEVCDPVENDSYNIGGVEVSNFVYPEWFEDQAMSASGKWDFLGILKAPFQLSAGGYASIMKIPTPTWSQVNAMKDTLAWQKGRANPPLGMISGRKQNFARLDSLRFVAAQDR
jgi:hypothetical protein